VCSRRAGREVTTDALSLVRAKDSIMQARADTVGLVARKGDVCKYVYLV
jgi:hypothetical protein